MGDCVYQTFIDCRGIRRCEVCGWNPGNVELHEYRVAKGLANKFAADFQQAKEEGGDKVGRETG